MFISHYYCFGIVGICLFAKKVWKKGYAVQAIKAVTNYAFKQIGLNTLEAGAYTENVNSIHLFERDGNTEQYTVKNKFRLVNKFVDTIF